MLRNDRWLQSLATFDFEAGFWNLWHLFFWLCHTIRRSEKDANIIFFILKCSRAGKPFQFFLKEKRVSRIEVSELGFLFFLQISGFEINNKTWTITRVRYQDFFRAKNNSSHSHVYSIFKEDMCQFGSSKWALFFECVMCQWMIF